MVVTSEKETIAYTVNNLCFILDKKTIIIKTPLQAFYLWPNGYWNPRFANNRMNLIREMIKIGEIRDLNDLAGYTNPGIQWRASYNRYDMNKYEIRNLL